MEFCNKCGKPFKYNSGGLTVDYTGDYCEGHSYDSDDINETVRILQEMWNQPLKVYDEDLENLKWGYTNKEITRQMLDVALQRGEITVHQYVKILRNGR